MKRFILLILFLGASVLHAYGQNVNAEREEAAKQRRAFGEERVVGSCTTLPGVTKPLYRYMFPGDEPDQATIKALCDRLRLMALRHKPKDTKKSRLRLMVESGFTPNIDTRMVVNVLDEAGEVTVTNFDSTFARGETHDVFSALQDHMVNEGVSPDRYQYVLYLNGTFEERLTMSLE